jgi:esterase/lipase superfamily enzyme
MLQNPAMHRFRAVSRLVATAFVTLAVSGCLGFDDSAVSSLRRGRPGVERDPTLLVATTRKPVAERPWFTGERGQGLVFAKAQLNRPDRSLTGRVASVVTGDWSIASVEPAERERAAEAFAGATAGEDVLLYIHGYRESFESAAINTAQLSEGIHFPGASALFTWPSAASTFSYVSDRESAMWSRDSLEELLKAVAQAPGGGRVHIVAHSMGTLLTLETLRMLRASGGDTAMAKIGAIVLAAPDIDVDLFTRSVERLGPDARKITVISATNDRALAVSSRLTGVARAGAAERERLEQLGVRVADASAFAGGLINHDLFLSNKDVQQVVRRAVEREQGQSASLL